ncbi:LysR family transcriptional regulator [Gemmobacter fulvus]|uniref:LysR family transcriptional regulator n=1 Tax=Gemmobacter fulvus TaxID=2840474 RepID=A0A975P4N6_9RHOB|nr:LysR family transcriptional regulator [Gemmobacter fulvus]MBT9247015.1 LysR family transcriptional regulator [Gemmobacter fulvus]QWK89785.1 LysR family transcriptional regulator [Gemmobacter fulvus]
MDLPPLTAIRAFEAAARAGSFVLAGAELGVSAAAISLQVKALEAHLGKRLFLRQGNRLTLTEAGRALYPRLGAALADMALATAELRGGPQRLPLIVSVLPSLAECWLIPALAGFAAEGLALRVEDDPVDFARSGAHLRLTYGIHAYPDHQLVPLFRDRIIAVAAPGGAALHIHTDWGASYPTEPNWAAWTAAQGLEAPDPARGLVVGSSGMALAAARAGLGQALVPGRFAAADLAAGRLLRLGGPALPMRADYMAIHPVAQARRRGLAALLAHLRQLSVPDAASDPADAP